MPGEEMYRWSQIPREVELSDDEVELRRQLREFLDAAYRELGLWEDPFNYRPRGIPRQEVDTSPETMRHLSALPIITREETLECYGTSGELESRGYWMPIDVESDQGRATDTKA
jgi:hypothetical protein